METLENQMKPLLSAKDQKDIPLNGQKNKPANGHMSSVINNNYVNSSITKTNTVEQSRQLAAIMFTDIVGYTSMMQQDEQDALMRIEHHRTVLESKVEEYSGRIVQYYGDGALIVFQSAYNAVFCAIEIQRILRSEPEVPLRIGIHLGEIIIKGSSTFGDGLNICSRIQSIGSEGTILISNNLKEQIINHPEIETRSLGKFTFKNVDKPIEIHGISNQGLAVASRKEVKENLFKQEGKGKAFSLVQKYQWLLFTIAILLMGLSTYLANQYLYNQSEQMVLENSIAVLPFANLSNDPEQDYFSDGITEDILNQLSKIADLNVKSRTSTLKYKDSTTPIPEIGEELGVKTILEGSVRKAGNQVRVVAQLIDVSSDTHIWSETYDREIDEIFKLQSEIAIEIASILQAKISEFEESSILRDAGTDITAYDYALKARNIWRNWNNEEDLEQILQLLEQSIRLDPNYAGAYALIGEVLYRGMRNYGVPPQIWVNQAEHMTDIALRLDSTLADAYLLKANIIRDQKNDSETAGEYFRKAMSLDPSNSKVMKELGFFLIEQGDLRRGVNLLIKAIDIGYTTNDPEYYTSWALIYMLLNETDKAENMLIEAKALAPDWVDPYMQLGRLYLYLEKYDAARENLEKALELSPENQSVIDALAWTALNSGDLEQADRYWSMYKEIEAEFIDQSQYIPFRHRLAYVKWLEGDQDQAMELFNEQMQLDLETQQRLRGFGTLYRGSHFYNLGAINAFLGNKGEAYAWLDSASSNGFFNLWNIENDPLLEPIRHDPQFKQLIEQRIEYREAMVNEIKRSMKRLDSRSFFRRGNGEKDG